MRKHLRLLVIPLSVIGLLTPHRASAEVDAGSGTVTTQQVPDVRLTAQNPALQPYDFGERGSAVRRLQKFLNVAIDGIYGKDTWMAHKSYLASKNFDPQIAPELPKQYWSGWYPVVHEGKKVFLPADKTKRCPRFEKKIREAGLPVDIFSYVAWRESRCEPKAIGWNYKAGLSHLNCRRSPAATYKKCPAVSSYDSGLVQINSSWVTVTAQVCDSPRGDMTVLLDPTCNLKVAKHLMENTSRPLGNWGF